MRATIVIPSYWGRRSTEAFNQGDTVYDHPTPVDLDGTLARALESISVLSNRDFNVVVLGCATSSEIAGQVESKVNDVVNQFKSYFPVTVLSHSFERRMKERLASLNMDPETVSLTGYSHIRNMCLVAAELARSEVAVLFDDDEVYEDPSYLDKVFENIGKVHEGKFVGAVAGYYQRPDGGYLLPPPEDDWWMTEWPMVSAMNEAFKIIGEEPRLKLTPFVFGGNMIIHSDVFRSVSFDPHVRRGEDIDFLTNCKFFDIDFLLDTQLAIKHLPPKTHIPVWAHFRENVYRFVYAREKLRRQVPMDGMRIVRVEELDPYPGKCMRDDLEDLIFKTSVLIGMNYLNDHEDFSFVESMRNIHIARYGALPEHDPFLWYLDFREKWVRLMEFLSSDEELSGALTEGL